MAVSPGDLKDVTLSCDTSALSDGDIIATTQEITDAFNIAGRGLLQSLILIDEDDQKQAVDIYFFSGSGTLGTENSAPSITDANAREYLGKVEVAAADYEDLGGVAVAMQAQVGLLLKGGGTNRTSLWVAAVCRSGTPTYSASGLKLRLGLIWA